MTSPSLLLFQLSPQGSMWGDYIKTMAILVGVCLLAVGALKLLSARMRAGGASKSGRVRVLAAQPLEPRKTLYVVRAGNTTVLVATSGDSVHFMTPLETADFLEETAGETALPANPTVFRKVVERMRNGHAGEKA